MQNLRYLASIGIIALGLAGCNGSAASTPSVPNSIAAANAGSSPASGREYLFVDRSTDRHEQLIERHLLHDGIPDRAPDLTIRAVESAGVGTLVAVAGDGTLFTNGENSAVYAYLAGHRTPDRSLAIPAPKRCTEDPSDEIELYALAADARGYLFVAFTTYFGSQAPTRHASSSACDGVWVFAPGARGNAKPVVTIPFRDPDFATALAVDASDNLYVALDQSRVVEFANATTQPKQSRLFRGPGHMMQAVATDESSNAFIGTTRNDYDTAHINRFTADGDPHQGPVNSIDIQAPGAHMVSSMAALARHVFVRDAYTGVEIYHAYQRGPQAPLYTLKANNVFTIAVGP